MSADLPDRYDEVAEERDVARLRDLARPLRGQRIVHVSSTRAGGGVAEVLSMLVPLTRALGIDVRWVISGGTGFFRCTNSMHNALQGDPVEIPRHLLDVYGETNRNNAVALGDTLRDADVVFVHDPQPAALLGNLPDRRGSWIWRCHIDMSRPHRPVWRYLRHPQFLAPPSVDPLSPKNIPLDDDEVERVAATFGIDRRRGIVVQVSRFDRFKDPVGVIQAFQLARRSLPGLQLVPAGGTATDDPEGAEVLEEVADVVVQKSTREGFGLTVAEGMWKGRPVILTVVHALRNGPGRPVRLDGPTDGEGSP